MASDIGNVSTKELKRRDFIINGNLWKVVFSLMFPLFVFSIFSYLYSIIDTIMCSGISKEAVDAVGALTQVTNMITALGTGIGSGGSIVIAREIGRKDYARAKRLSSTVFIYTFLIAILTIAIVVPLTDPLLSLVGISDSLIAIGRDYFIVSVITSSLMMINTVYLGVEKAKGSMTWITILNVGVVLVKIALNALFLYVFHWTDMVFVSLATLIANASLTLYVFVRLSEKKYLFHFSFKNIDWSHYTLGKLTFISFPIFLGKFIFSLGKVVINGLAKDYGDDVVGALGVSNNMGGSITNPISSVEDSTSAIISTNIGAGKIKRAIDTFYVGLVYSLSVAIIGVVIITIFDTPITMFFARSATDQAEFASHISKVFFYEKMGIVALALNSSVLGLLYGFGYTRLSMVINIARVFVFRIPSFLVCKYGLGMTDGYLCAGISMGFSNISIGIVALIAAITIIMKIKERQKAKEGKKTLTQEEKNRLNEYIDHYLETYKPYKENAAWCYEDGVVLEGAYQLYRVTRDRKYLDFCQRYYETYIAKDGSIKAKGDRALDDIEPGVALFYVNSLHHEDKFEKALTNLYASLLKQPCTQDGSYWHKGKYPNQVWLDGLYMACPFGALMASRGNGRKENKIIAKQFSNVLKNNRDPKDGTFHHAYDETRSMPWADKTTGLSPNVWLRSVGWLAMAAVDVGAIFQRGWHYFLLKPVKKVIKEVTDSLASVEDPKTHRWRDLPFVHNEKNYFESSGSLMLAYSEMKGAQLALLPSSDMARGVMSFEGVIRHSFVGGHLQDICLVSGLDNEKRDGSVDYYLSEPITKDDPKGVGPLLMAYAEYLTLSY